jgi:plasmid replication initiation protein
MPSIYEDRSSTSLIKVESNLEEFPFFQLGRRRQEGTATYERTIEGKNASVLKQRFEVSASKYSLPGPLDMDVYLAVLELLEIRGGMPESGRLYFSLYELLQILGWQLGGRTYAKLKESLRRIALTGIESENAFYSKGEDRLITDSFRLWSVHFSETTTKGSDSESSSSRHYIRFDEWFIRSFQDHYLKGLDTTFYWELDSPLSRRLYRLVDHKIRDSQNGLKWEADLLELQRQLPLAKYPYASKVKTVLKPAHKELVGKGFLASVEYLGRNRVVYVITQSFAHRKKTLELKGTPEEVIAIQTLRDEGLSGDVARDLVARYGPEHCLKYADALPHQKNLRSPAGWLRRAIEEGYELPEVPYSELRRDLPPSRLAATSSRRPQPPRPSGQEMVNQDEVYVEKNRDPPVEDPHPSGRSDQPAPEKLSAPDSRAQAEWHALVEGLVALRGRDSLPPWFEQFEGGQLEGSTLTVVVPNSYAANHLNENFGEDLVRLWRERSGDDDTVLQVTTDLSSGVRARLCVDA